MNYPAPSEIKAAREAADLTQTKAAELVYSALRTWQQWEAGDRKMPPGLWELFCIKTVGASGARPVMAGCELCGHPYGDDWLDEGETCPKCKLVQ